MPPMQPNPRLIVIAILLSPLVCRATVAQSESESSPARSTDWTMLESSEFSVDGLRSDVVLTAPLTTSVPSLASPASWNIEANYLRLYRGDSYELIFDVDGRAGYTNGDYIETIESTWSNGLELSVSKHLSEAESGAFFDEVKASVMFSEGLHHGYTGGSSGSSRMELQSRLGIAEAETGTSMEALSGHLELLMGVRYSFLSDHLSYVPAEQPPMAAMPGIVINRESQTSNHILSPQISAGAYWNWKRLRWGGKTTAGWGVNFSEGPNVADSRSFNSSITNSSETTWSDAAFAQTTGSLAYDFSSKTQISLDLHWMVYSDVRNIYDTFPSLGWEPRESIAYAGGSVGLTHQF
ncbi:hypothetical protein CEE69_04625 [Rhodopirellula bahusiensis]|uniref:DUF481 domain-containing protein n=2 Tax=Rhodopirellula bahusiensis TaxID=2014065 RepID=A0A2G1WC86_9BACT|nr:hypothetical protein CEE69_04625 [Rhodopirellula bahusiensis]